MNCFGLTDRGLTRADNQDTFVIREVPSADCVIFAVCDGVGGQNSGSVASELAKRAFSEYILAKLTSRVHKNPDIRLVLEEACAEANQVVFQYSMFTEDYHGMGTTLVGGVLYGSGKAFLANIGDSRAYHIVPKENKIRQITTDHSLVEMYVAAGILTREEARTHKQKNIITRSVGGEEKIEADLFELTLKKNELILLCSDGVSNPVSDEELLQLAKKYRDPRRYCEKIKELVLQRGAADNLTAVMAVR